MNAEKYYWYKTLSAMRPPEFVFYINFTYVGMEREATPKEIDRFKLVEIGQMSREDFAEKQGV